MNKKEILYIFCNVCVDRIAKSLNIKISKNLIRFCFYHAHGSEVWYKNCSFLGFRPEKWYFCLTHGVIVEVTG